MGSGHGDSRSRARAPRRQRERSALDLLVSTVRAGESQTLVLRGDAGVGKSALLDYLVERAADCRILHAVGVEVEMELAYPGPHQLRRKGPGPSIGWSAIGPSTLPHSSRCSRCRPLLLSVALGGPEARPLAAECS